MQQELKTKKRNSPCFFCDIQTVLLFKINKFQGWMDEQSVVAVTDSYVECVKADWNFNTLVWIECK